VYVVFIFISDVPAICLVITMQYFSFFLLAVTGIVNVGAVRFDEDQEPSDEVSAAQQVADQSEEVEVAESTTASPKEIAIAKSKEVDEAAQKASDHQVAARTVAEKKKLSASHLAKAAVAKKHALVKAKKDSVQADVTAVGAHESNAEKVEKKEQLTMKHKMLVFTQERAATLAADAKSQKDDADHSIVDTRAVAEESASDAETKADTAKLKAHDAAAYDTQECQEKAQIVEAKAAVQAAEEDVEKKHGAAQALQAQLKEARDACKKASTLKIKGDKIEATACEGAHDAADKAVDLQMIADKARGTADCAQRKAQEAAAAEKAADARILAEKARHDAHRAAGIASKAASEVAHATSGAIVHAATVHVSTLEHNKLMAAKRHEKAKQEECSDHYVAAEAQEAADGQEKQQEAQQAAAEEQVLQNETAPQQEAVQEAPQA